MELKYIIKESDPVAGLAHQAFLEEEARQQYLYDFNLHPEMTQQKWATLDYDAGQRELDDLREGIRTEGQQGLSSRRLVQPLSEFIEAGDEDDYDRGGSNYACPQCDSYCEPDHSQAILSRYGHTLL